MYAPYVQKCVCVCVCEYAGNIEKSEAERHTFIDDKSMDKYSYICESTFVCECVAMKIIN